MVSRKADYVKLTLILVFVCVTCLLNRHYKLFVLNIHDVDGGADDGLMVMTFNVNASDSANFTPEVQQWLIEFVIDEQPDILFFQELSPENWQKVKPQLDSIYGPCEELDGRDVEVHRTKFYSHHKMHNFKRYKCTGDINFNELDSLTLKYLDSMNQQMNVMSAEFEIEPGRWVTVFSGHLRSSAYSTARRSMGKDSNWWEGLSLYWKNYKIGKRIRDYEARNVRRFIDEARSEGKPVIVAGDLNDWCGSDCLDILMGDDLKDAWSEGGNGFGWTYFGWHLRLRLDHILYSDELELTDVKVLDTDLSDHKPLMAKFRLK